MLKILAYRDAFGIGDWIMTMSVLKMLKGSYPDCILDLNLVGKLGVAPRLVLDIVKNLDVEFNRIFFNNNLTEIQKFYDIVTGHIIYDFRTRNNLIHSMVQNTNSRTGLEIKYDENLYSHYIGSMEILEVPKKFILMPSCGKDTRISKHKDWGYDNLNSLCSLLSREGYDIVQIGVNSDFRLVDAKYRYFDLSLSQIHFLMSQCTFFVGLVNGLSVYSGHHSIKTYLLHHNNRLPFECTLYDNQKSLDVTNLNSNSVFKTIMKMELVKHS